MLILRNLVILLLVAVPAFAGTSYYWDPDTTSTTNDGSFAEPFKTVAQVNSKAFGTGDDVYIKVGSSQTPNSKLQIDWDGTSSDPVVIGAYYGENFFGLNGNPRPILDGGGSVPNDTTGMINYFPEDTWNHDGYVHVVDLQIQNIKGYGISINGRNGTIGAGSTTGHKVENCYVKNVDLDGIVLARVTHSIILNNTVEYPNKDTVWGFRGAGLGFTGMNKNDRALYNVVRGNTMFHAYEGIGTYKGARYTLIEDNTIYDCRSYHVYVANGQYAIIRDNLVYESDSQLPGDVRDRLIGSDSEGWDDRIAQETGYMWVYDNYLAGGRIGLFLENNAIESDVYQEYNRIKNNTIVDCDENFWFNNPSGNTWQENIIKNNLSVIITSGLEHASHYSFTGITWDANCFNTSVTGNAATNQIIESTPLVKMTGWRDLAAGNVSKSDFELASGATDLINTSDYLTTITSSSGSGTSFTVDDPLYFYDGTYWPDDDGDTIETEAGQSATITGISGSTITVDSSISFVQNEGITVRNYYGSDPEIGAKEFTEAGEAAPVLSFNASIEDPIACDGAGPNTVTHTVTTDLASTVRHTHDTEITDYDSMWATAMNTSDGLTHTYDITHDCNTAVPRNYKARANATGLDSNLINFTITVSAEVGSTNPAISSVTINGAATPSRLECYGDSTQSFWLGLATDIAANCRWDPLYVTYALMRNQFTETEGGTAGHAVLIEGTCGDGASETNYINIVCQNTAGTYDSNMTEIELPIGSISAAPEFVKGSDWVTFTSP